MFHVHRITRGGLICLLDSSNAYLPRLLHSLAQASCATL